MHPRVCLHQVGFLSESTPAFIAFCRELGIAHMTLVNPAMLGAGMLDMTQDELARGGPKVANLAQPFARYPDLPGDTGEAASRMNEAIDAAAALGAGHVYVVSGGRGHLDWEDAAARFAELIAPCITHAAQHGIAISVEPANLLNADIHIAHTLGDTIRLAEMSGIGVTADLGACWQEGGLASKFRRAMPMLRLVQLSDYVAGDRTTPCRAVPGDGMVPIERIVASLLDLGYEGLFDLELLGPRIEVEGHRSAFVRAAQALSDILTRLGA